MAQARIGQDYDRATALTAESCKAQLRQWQSAAAEAGRLRETAAAEAGRLRASLGGRM